MPPFYFLEHMASPSDLLRSALNFKDSIAGLSFNEVQDFCFAILNIAVKKIDLKYVWKWNPGKFLTFMRAMAEIAKDNDAKFDRNEKCLCRLLNNYPIYHEMLRLADDVYGRQKVELEGGWRTIRPPYGVVLNDVESGLVSQIYRREKNGRTEYAYALAGTDPVSIADWENNVLQLGGESTQYVQSAKNAIIIAEMAKADNAKLFFTGHSLGGGLASFCALATKQHAIVFNPAGVSEDTLAQLPSKPAPQDYDALIEGFYTTNDILNLFQDASQLTEGMRLVFPQAIGRRYYVKSGCLSPIMSHTMRHMADGVNAVRALAISRN